MTRLTSLLFLAAMTVGALPADVIYEVSITTAGYQGQAGYLDFQLGRGPDSENASVAIQSFVSDGSLSGPAEQAGDVTGSLPGTVTITNTTQFNDYFQPFSYGSLLRFGLTFSGTAISAPSGTAAYGSPFYFGLYDTNQVPLGPVDALGNAFLIQVNSNGSTTPQIFNGAVAITNASAVPEPSMRALLGVGLAACALMLCRRTFRAHT